MLTALFPFRMNASKIILNEEASEYNWFTIEEIKNLKTLPLTYEMAELADKINV
jgi:hypothetical protein